MDRPRPLMLAGPGAIAVAALSAIGSAVSLIASDPFPDRPPPSKRSHGKHGGRPRAGWFKGSAEAKRATRRGGNQAKTRFAK